MEAIESARYAHSDGMGAFMCFMAVRLLEMRRVLKDTGSIYLHCDPTASHYLKAVMDAVFGWKEFVNEIIWCYSHGGKSGKRFGRKHDCILYYSISNQYTFNADTVRIPMKSGKDSFGGRLETDEEGRKYRLVYGTKNSKGETRYYKYYLDAGKIPEDYWTDFNSLQSGVRERTGYPTQKPIALYERIIKASSNEGNMVLDPFAGCATTLIAAEKLKRQWVGIDIWDNAKAVVLQRLEKEGLIVQGTTDGMHGHLFPSDVVSIDKPPLRTDTGESAAPNLRTKVKIFEPRGPKTSRAQMYEHLLEQYGSKCQGCDRTFDDKRYLQLDHNTPRADGGLNHISNRVLLCGPCNRLKSHVYTLSGLRKMNKKNGWIGGVK